MRPRRALTIVEMVVAVSLLTLAMLAIMTLCPASNALAYQAQIRLQADNLAQSILEKERQLPPDQLVPQAPTAMTPVTDPSFPDLHPSLEIIAVGPANRGREIRVKVSWSALGRNSETSRATVVTYLHR